MTLLLHLQLSVLLALHFAAAVLAGWLLISGHTWWRFCIAFVCFMLIEFRLLSGRWLRSYQQ